MGERLLRHNTGIVDEELCRKVVCAVNDEIIVLDKVHDVFAGDESPVGVDLDIRIDCLHGFLGGLYLCLAHISGGMNDLPLEIGQVYFVCICNADRTYACGSQIHCSRSTQTAGTDNQHLGIQQLLLSLDTDFFQNDVAGVTLDLFVGKCHVTVHLP